MIWQDVVIASGSAVLGAASLASLLKGRKVPLELAIPYIVVLALFCMTFLTLKMYGAAAVNGASCLVWVGLAHQTVWGYSRGSK